MPGDLVMAVVISEVFHLTSVPAAAPLTVKVTAVPLQIVVSVGLVTIEKFTGSFTLMADTLTNPKAPTAGSVTLTFTFAVETFFNIKLARPLLSVVTTLVEKVAVPESKEILSGVLTIGLLF